MGGGARRPQRRRRPDVDLMDLYHRRGVSLVRARLAATAAARAGYARLASLYSQRIDTARADHGVEAGRAL